MINRIKGIFNEMFGRIPTSKDIDKIVRKSMNDQIEKDTQFIQSMQKLDIKDGDLIVLKYPGILPAKTSISIRESLQEALRKWGYNGLKVILLEDGMDIGVFKKANRG